MTKPTTQFLDVAGKKTQLTVGGEGPPLLYLHSASGETEWMPFHEQLAKHFTVYLPAAPVACGPSLHSSTASTAPAATPPRRRGHQA